MPHELLENINEILRNPAIITLAGLALTACGLKAREQSRRIRDYIAEIAETRHIVNEFESEYAPRLAMNTAILGGNITDIMGTDGLGLFRIGYAFNPAGERVPEFYESHQEEKQRLRDMLANQIRKYTKQMKGE